MKKLYYIMGILVVFSIVSSAVILILSPDIIPAHYNSAGEVDRFGSKYENLLFPGFTLGMAAFFAILLKYQKQKDTNETEEKILLWSAIFSLALFDALGLFFGITSMNYQSNPEAMNPELIGKFVSILVGVLFIVMGTLLPKVNKNSIFGVRTSWSMKSDKLWQKNQHFGGILAIICGIAMIIMAVFVPGKWNLVMLILAVIIWGSACTAASYIYWKKEQ